VVRDERAAGAQSNQLRQRQRPFDEQRQVDAALHDGAQHVAQPLQRLHRLLGAGRGAQQIRQQAREALVTALGQVPHARVAHQLVERLVRGAEETNSERDRILEALARTTWNRSEAAKLLGMNRSTLWRKMRKLGIESSSSSPEPANQTRLL